MKLAAESAAAMRGAFLALQGAKAGGLCRQAEWYRGKMFRLLQYKRRLYFLYKA